MNRTAAELAEYLGAKIHGDASRAVSGVASPENASASDLIYLDAPKFAARAQKSAAACVIALARYARRRQNDHRARGPEIRLRESLPPGFCSALARAAGAAKSEIHASALIVAPSAKIATVRYDRPLRRNRRRGGNRRELRHRRVCFPRPRLARRCPLHSSPARHALRRRSSRRPRRNSLRRRNRQRRLRLRFRRRPLLEISAGRQNRNRRRRRNRREHHNRPRLARDHSKSPPA